MAVGDYQDVIKVVVAHKNALRSIPILKNSQHVYIIEAQMGRFQSASFWHALRDYSGPNSKAPTTIFMHGPSSPTNSAGEIIPGISVTGDDKMRFVNTACDFLRGDRVCLNDPSQGFVTTIYSGEETSRPQPETIMNDFKRQLLAFRREIKPTADPVHGQSKMTFSGKSGGCNDDMTMAFLFGLYHSSIFMWQPQWTVLVPGLPRSTLMAGAHFNKIIAKEADDFHTTSLKEKREWGQMNVDASGAIVSAAKRVKL